MKGLPKGVVGKGGAASSLRRVHYGVMFIPRCGFDVAANTCIFLLCTTCRTLSFLFSPPLPPQYNSGLPQFFSFYPSRVGVDCAVQCQPRAAKIKDAVYKLRNPVQQIDSFVGDVVRAHVPKMDLDEVFSNKDSIADAVEEKLADQMEEFGFQILQALVINVEPDRKVQKAMNAMETARRMRIASETKANADHFVKVKKAEAEAEAKALQGQGIARQRAAICQGLKDSIGTESAELSAARVSELLLITQYFDTLEKMSDEKGTKIFIPHSIGALEDVSAQISRGVLAAI